jgi:hypothetical protein
MIVKPIVSSHDKSECYELSIYMLNENKEIL